MYVELDNGEFFLKQARSIKIHPKIAARHHICFLYLARAKVEWDERARWTPHREKTNTSHLKYFFSFVYFEGNWILPIQSTRNCVNPVMRRSCK